MIEYTGLLNQNQEIQNSNIINYERVNNTTLQPKELFNDFHKLAISKLETLTLEEKKDN